MYLITKTQEKISISDQKIAKDLIRFIQNKEEQNIFNLNDKVYLKDDIDCVIIGRDKYTSEGGSYLITPEELTGQSKKQTGFIIYIKFQDGQDGKIQIGLDKLEKAIHCHMKGASGHFIDEGISITGDQIQMIKFDANKYLGWNSDFNPTADSLLEYSEAVELNKHHMETAKRKIQYCLENNMFKNIGDNNTLIDLHRMNPNKTTNLSNEYKPLIG